MTEDRLRQIANEQPEFSKLLGIQLIEATPERVVMDLPVTEALSNRNGVMHGGAILGLTDNAGGRPRPSTSSPARIR